MKWDKNSIGQLSSEQIKNLLRNATAKNEFLIAQLCEEELSARAVSSSPKHKHKGSTPKNDRYVAEFHFVCPSEKSIEKNSDGTFWTGTWVVSTENAEKSIRFRASLALHKAKSEPSYLQGRIVNWRRTERERTYSGETETKTAMGIDFLIEPFNTSMPWKGNGSGEKGYEWAEVALD